MKQSAFPAKFGTVWGADQTADYITTPIPATTSTSGRASLQEGFPSSTATPLASGGAPPDIKDFNGAFNMLSAAAQAFQAGFFGPFDSAFAADIGGYPLNAIVSDATAGTFWVSTADDNTTTPGASGAFWQSLFFGLAPLASPALTGTPTVPTAASGTNTTQAASTAFVTSAVSAEALRASTVESNLQSTKAPLYSPAFTGTPTAPTPGASDNSTLIPTTAWVRNNFFPRSSWSASFTPNGYEISPTGRVSQWGTYTSGTDGFAYITFPIAFPSACTSINVNDAKMTGITIHGVYQTPTTTTFVVRCVATNTSGTGTPVAAQGYFQATGY